VWHVHQDMCQEMTERVNSVRRTRTLRHRERPNVFCAAVANKQTLHEPDVSCVHREHIRETERHVNRVRRIKWHRTREHVNAFNVLRAHRAMEQE